MGNQFVTVGESGKTAWSYDGTTWTLVTASGFTGENFQDVCYGLAFGEPTFMSVGSMAGVLWSRDGLTWTQVTAARSPAGSMPALATCATDGTGTWVACNRSQTTPWRAIGDPATSFWDRQTTSLAHAIWAVRYGSGLFVAVTQSGELATSPTGSTWTNRTTGMNPSDDWLQDVTYGGSQYVAMGGGGAGANEFKILTSPDGATWTLHTIAGLVDYYGNAIAYGNGLFVVVGLTGLVATSPDGTTWTLRSPGHSTDLNDVVYSDGVWVSVGADGNLYETTDPTGTWTSRTSGFSTSAITSVTVGQATYRFTTDAWIAATRTGTFAANAMIVDSAHWFIADAILNRSSSISFTADAMMAVDLSGTTVGRNPHDRAEQHFGNMPATAVAYDRFTSVEAKLRYVWDRLALYESAGFKEGSFTATAVLHRLITATFSANAVVGSPPTISSWLANAIVRRAQSGSFTAAADVLRTQTGSAQANAVIRRTSTGSFTADASIFSGHTGSFTADGIVKKTVAGSFAADAITKKTATGSFTADAVIGSSTESGLLGDHTLGQNKLGGS